jgi:hypothetical protein
MDIKNLTQHAPTESQVQAGVTGVDEHALEFLNFSTPPSVEEIETRAYALAALAAGYASAMVGGAPYLMGPLVAALKSIGVQPLFSFTERKSVEKTNPDGSVVKTSVFAHVAWVAV